MIIRSILLLCSVFFCEGSNLAKSPPVSIFPWYNPVRKISDVARKVPLILPKPKHPNLRGQSQLPGSLIDSKFDRAMAILEKRHNQRVKSKAAVDLGKVVDREDQGN